MKKNINELAVFGGEKLFKKPISTSNLVKPNVESFLKLLKKSQTLKGEQELINNLESMLAKFHKVENCISVCNGFWALVITIRAVALANKSEVIMPSLTYRRLADVVAWTGLIPRFCEVDPETLAISPATIERHINSNTALIIGVHPIVNCCDASGLEDLAKSRSIPIIFDSVESVYETINNKKVGSFGAAECFSFHASKLINGFEGGYITTNSFSLAKKIRSISRLGNNKESPYSIEASLPPAHAAMAIQGLVEVESNKNHNFLIYQYYKKNITKIPGIELLLFNDNESTSFKTIVVKLNNYWKVKREILLKILNAEGILSRPYYYPPLHLKEMDYQNIVEPLKFTEKATLEYILMPCGYQVTENDISKVIKLLYFIDKNSTKINNNFRINYGKL